MVGSYGILRAAGVWILGLENGGGKSEVDDEIMSVLLHFRHPNFIGSIGVFSFSPNGFAACES